MSPTISATNTVQNDNSSTSPENDALSALLTDYAKQYPNVMVQNAAEQGAKVIVLPECFLSFYPSASITQSRYDEGMTDLFERMWLSGVDVPGPVVDRLARVCFELGVYLAIGVNERESNRPSSASPTGS